MTELLFEKTTTEFFNIKVWCDGAILITPKADLEYRYIVLYPKEQDDLLEYFLLTRGV